MKNTTVNKNLLEYIDLLSKSWNIEYSSAESVLNRIRFDIINDRIKLVEKTGELVSIHHGDGD